MVGGDSKHVKAILHDVLIVFCTICRTNETDNPYGICDDCKMSMGGNDDMS